MVSELRHPDKVREVSILSINVGTNEAHFWDHTFFHWGSLSLYPKKHFSRAVARCGSEEWDSFMVRA
jgi:hypothetical protein